jgi:hypothetical protein
MNKRIYYYFLPTTFILCCILIIMRRPDMLLNPQPFAEDGSIFISDAIFHGSRSVFMQYAGYLHFIPRIVTLLSLHVSIWMGNGIDLVPLFMNVSAIILSSASIVFILFPRFEWIAPFYVRVAMVFSVILLPGMGEVYGTITNLQWWIAIFLFLISFDMIVNNRIPRGSILLFIVPATITGPFGVFVILACATVFISRCIKTKSIQYTLNETLFSILICAGGFIQVIESLIHRTGGTFNLSNFIIYFPRVLFSTVFSRLVLPNFVNSVHTYQFASITLLGVVICYLIYRFNSDRKQMFIIPFSACVILLIMTFKGSYSFFALYNESFYDGATRYAFIPLSLMMISFLSGFHKKGLKQIFAIAICILFVINVQKNFSFPPFEDTHYTENVRSFVLHGQNKCKAPINPGGWAFEFPCK